MVTLSNGVTFSTANGGSLRVVDDAPSLDRIGVTTDGWAYWDDLYIYRSVLMALSGNAMGVLNTSIDLIPVVLSHWALCIE
jgi:hypothetical protein